MSDNRNEAPTQRRIQESRRRGDPVGRSHEFVMAATLGASVLALSNVLPGAAASLSDSIRRAIVSVGDPTPRGAALVGLVGDGIGQALAIVLPIGFAVAAVGVVTNLAAGGFIVSGASVRFDPSRLNAIKGLKRIADRSMLTRLAIAVAKLAVLAVLCWEVLGTRIIALITHGGSSVASISADALHALFGLGIGLTILLGAIAVVDFMIQRRRALGNLKMSRDEVRREYKESEGDPLIRSQRRARARQLAFARMMDAIPTADVIVVNPTEIAIALRYDSLTMRAPRIVAKGRRLMAARIREAGERHGVPILQDKPLARALYGRPLGSEVPPHLYKAVARILILVHRARTTMIRLTPGVAR
jgi:flagellar biosynthesis protein FlhB